MASHNFLVNEELIQYMLGHLRLSRVDNKFLENIFYKSVADHSITTNQVDLFNKIVIKYTKQFTKKNIHIDDIKSLQWKSTVIESSTQFTEAYISIENELIYFKSPYNKEFIQELKRNPIYTLQWIKDKRMYCAKYGLSNLKAILTLAKKYFKAVNLCPVTSTILDTVKSFDDVIVWNPTLVYSNNMLFVAGANVHLMDAIKDIPLDNNLKNISKLLQYGIRIDESVVTYLQEYVDDLDKLKFAINFDPVVEIKDIEKVFSWLKELGVDAVFDCGNSWRNTIKDQNTFKDTIEKYGFERHHLAFDKPNKIVELYDSPVIIRFFSYLDIEKSLKNLFKIIRFTNSEPVDLKL